MYQIGRMQWTKNKLLEELRDTKHRYDEEKKHEKEEMGDIEQKMRMKNNQIDLEKIKQESIVNLNNFNILLILIHIERNDEIECIKDIQISKCSY